MRNYQPKPIYINVRHVIRQLLEEKGRPVAYEEIRDVYIDRWPKAAPSNQEIGLAVGPIREFRTLTVCHDHQRFTYVYWADGLQKFLRRGV